ncbi:ribose-phosphate diphosphokinase [Acuticoccus sediminis]|uniref:ribose-phosphate diphosphokinase n=1 Tax=Acuticoccus sediminis TaxID=2184697 RepID=UPI001CFD0992|nr:ribose-phosphate diphosphokinase [Acuticoccus sediminis]
MTTFAEITPSLRRLFTRLDQAPAPHAADLAALLARWRTERGDHAVPVRSVEDAGGWGPAAAVFRFDPGTRDHLLVAGTAAETLLGACPVGTRLMEASDRRMAVRLRRLFETVRETREPVLAEFPRKEHGDVVEMAEVLAAPLSSDGVAVDMILSGVAVRAVPQRASALHHGHAAPIHAPFPLLFALDGEDGLGSRIAASLGVPLSPHEVRIFEDGEHKARPLCEVRGHDAYVVDTLVADDEQSPNDKLCRLLFFIAALRDSGATRVSAVVPYLCYARKDRKTKPHDPVTTRYVAQLFEAVGTQRVIAMDVHNIAAFQNAFRCDTEHLSAIDVFVRHFLAGIGDAPVTVVSPDLGGGKRADLFREALEAALGRPVDKAFMEKARSMGRVSGDLFAGEVAGRHAIVIDDLISTGTTMARVAAECRSRGARRVSIAATHGLFADGAEAMWREPGIDEVVVTDTVPPFDFEPGLVRGRLVVLGTADIFADAIRADSLPAATEMHLRH